MQISDKDAHDCLLDKTDHKLTLAKYHLDKIDTSVSYNYDAHHFQQEYHMESFVIFSTMVIEALCFEINREFGFEDKTRIESMIGKLRKSIDQKQQNVLEVIGSYFSRPPVNLGINEQLPDNTVLWQLRNIRNKIAHNPIFNRSIIDGEKTLFLIYFPRDDGVILQRTTDNPRREFQVYFDKLVEFRDKIRIIIPQKYHSSLYKTLKDSELQSSLS